MGKILKMDPDTRENRKRLCSAAMVMLTGDPLPDDFFPDGYPIKFEFDDRGGNPSLTLSCGDWERYPYWDPLQEILADTMSDVTFTFIDEPIEEPTEEPKPEVVTARQETGRIIHRLARRLWPWGKR